MRRDTLVPVCRPFSAPPNVKLWHDRPIHCPFEFAVYKLLFSSHHPSFLAFFLSFFVQEYARESVLFMIPSSLFFFFSFSKACYTLISSRSPISHTHTHTHFLSCVYVCVCVCLCRAASSKLFYTSRQQARCRLCMISEAEAGYSLYFYFPLYISLLPPKHASPFLLSLFFFSLSGMHSALEFAMM
jgi:hypothetical protein